MNVDLGIWNKLTRMVVVLCLAAGLLAVALWYLPLIQTNERMRKEVARLDKQIQKETETEKQLKSSLEALKDPKAVERLARENLGYAKPGEIVVHFEAAPTNRPSLP